MKNNNTLAGYVAITISMLFWGFSFVWTKHLLQSNFPVFTIVFFRLLLASVIFFTLFKLSGKLQKIQKGDLKLFILLSLFEPFLYFIGEDFGLKYVDASFAAVIVGLIPIVVSITMYFTDNEPLHCFLLIGTLISIGGIILITFGSGSFQNFSFKGLAFLSIALLAAGGYSVFLTRLVSKYNPVTITTYQNLLSIPLYLPFVCIFDLQHWNAIQLNISAILSLLCLAVFCSAGAYMLYAYAAQKVHITKLSVFTNAIPIVTMVVSAILGLEQFTAMKAVGILIVVLGVIISQQNPKLLTTRKSQ